MRRGVISPVSSLRSGTTPGWASVGWVGSSPHGAQMIDHTPMRGNYNRFDLMVAIGIAALVAVWLLVYAVLLIKYGGHSG